MKRLIEAKPRPKKKEIVMTVKFTFESFSDDNTDAKTALKAFKTWMRDAFPEWNQSILYNFLNAANLKQPQEEDKYVLTVNIDKILKDESTTRDVRGF